MKIHFFIAVLSYFLIIQETLSETVVWDEAIDGDAVGTSFSQPYIPTRVSIALGSNKIIGSRISTVSGISDSDIFSFEIAEGQIIENIALGVTDVDYQGSTQTWFRQVWALATLPSFGELPSRDFTPFEGFAAVTEIGNTLGEYTIQQFDIDLELGSGIYVLFGGSDTKNGDPRATVSYEWNIQVATVPLPGAVWLLGSTLGILHAFKRRNLKE